jgi:hypothetical protein
MDRRGGSVRQRGCLNIDYDYASMHDSIASSLLVNEAAPWLHGAISRQEAERLLQKFGFVIMNQTLILHQPRAIVSVFSPNIYCSFPIE